MCPILTVRQYLSDCCIPRIGPGVGQMVLLQSISLDVLFKVDQRGNDKWTIDSL